MIGWIFGAIGQGSMAKRRGVPGGWMGWIPVLRLILLGRLADHYLAEVKNTSGERQENLPLLAVAAYLLCGAAGFLWYAKANLPANATVVITVTVSVTVLAAVLMILYLVKLYTTLYYVYFSCTPDDAKLLTVLTVILPVLAPFFLFALRKKASGMPLRRMQI